MMARRSGWIEMDFPRMRSIFESLSTISSICGDLLCQHRLRSGHAREHELLPRGVSEFRVRRMQRVGGGGLTSRRGMESSRSGSSWRSQASMWSSPSAWRCELCRDAAPAAVMKGAPPPKEHCELCSLIARCDSGSDSSICEGITAHVGISAGGGRGGEFHGV